ncbi:hypothetical protein IG631_00638 [Alternaria alternata]|nr:hypothetical protein IG631_00638 [Alternaria alternata]
MEVIVSHGVRTKNWVIPKALLSHHSEFFRAACDGPFKEGIENKITLHDCRPEVFEGYVHWLYFATLPVHKPLWNHIYCISHFWILGDRLLVAEFKNAVLRDIHEAHYLYDIGVVAPQEVKCIWRHTSDESALRRWVLDFVSLDWKEHCDSYGQLAWMDLFREIPDFGSNLLLRLGTKKVELKIEKYLEEVKTAHGELTAKRQ